MRYFYFQLILLIILGIGAYPQNTGRNKVLVVFSYEETFPTYEHVNRALREFADTVPVDFDHFYLDTKYRCDAQYLMLAIQFLKEKIAKREKYDAVITVDDNALRIVLENQEKLFPTTPVIFLGVNNIEYALSMNNKKNVTGVVEAVSMQETIELMKSIQPNLQTVYVITDETETAISDVNLFLGTITHFPELQYIILNTSNYCFDKLYEKISEIEDHQGAFLLIAAYKDKDDKYMNFNQISKSIVETAKLPVYHIYLHGVGKGLTGGYVVSHYEQGRKALQIIHSIFTGKDIRDIKVLEESPNIPVVDALQLAKFNISPENIPNGIMTLNKPLKTVQITKQLYKILVISIGTLLTCMLIVLILTRHLSRKNRKLKADKNIYLKLFIESPMPMIISDPDDLSITDANISASTMYGYVKEELLTMQITDLNKLPKESVKELANKILSEKSVVLNLKHYKKSGEPMFVEVFTSSLFLSDKQMIISVIFDQTAQKQMENDIRLALEQARENELLKASFLRTMNHEVRTPLNGVMGFTELLLAKTNPDETTVKYGLYIRSCSEKLMEIIDSVLDLSMLENKQTKVNISRFDVNDLVENIYEKNVRQFEGKDVQFQFSVSTNSCGEISSDRAKIFKTINHLITNAVKFTHTGKVVLQAECTEKIVRFSVEDTGIGIDPAFHQKIFDRFRQLELTNTRQYGGAGVGLAIVKEYVSLLKGRINLQSALGEGSRFTIELPRLLETETNKNQQTAFNMSIN